MNRKTNKKQGFTLVELLVVIAILAILASVSVVGYMGFTQKAKESNDVTMTTQMNNILQANEASHKAETMKDVIIQLEEAGLDLNKLNPTADNYSYVWDQKANRIFLLNNDKKVIAPNDKKLTSIEDTYVMIKDNAGAKKFLGYSLYLQDGFKLADNETLVFSQNLESGNNENLNLKYEDDKKEVVNITTKGGNLTLNNPNASVYHNGSAKVVDIENVDLNNSYHLNGKVTEKIVVTNARVVISTKSEVNNIELSETATKESKLVIEDAVKQDIVITSKNETATIKVEQATTSESKIYAPQNTINKAESKIEANNLVEQKPAVKEDTETVEEFLTRLLKDINDLNNPYLFLKLEQDIILPSIADNDALSIPKGKTIVLDLNGYKIEAGLKTGSSNRHNYAIGNHGNLTVMDSVGTGSISGRGVENFGTMVVKGGKFYAVDKVGGAAIWNEGDLEIHGGEFLVTGENQVGSPSDNYGVSAINNSGTLLITAGIFKDINRRAYSIVSSGEITINPSSNNAVVVEGAHGALAIDAGTAKVYGGSYSSTDFYGLYVSNDGMGEDPEQAAVEVYGGTFNGKTYAVWIGSDYNDPVNSTIEIYGGTFLKPLNAQDCTREGAIKISGGNFAVDPSQYLKEGFVAKKGKDGYFTVVPKK